MKAFFFSFWTVGTFAVDMQVPACISSTNQEQNLPRKKEFAGNPMIPDIQLLPRLGINQ